VSSKSPYKSVADLQKSRTQILMSSAGVGSSSHNDAIMVGEILGFEKKLKIVPGYAGTEGELAMMRGEIHGQIGSLDSMRSIITNGEARPLLMIFTKRVKEFPNVPNIYEYAKEGKMKAMADLMVVQALLSRPYAGPPGIPPERLKFLRKAFEAAWNDPELIAMAKKTGVSLEFQDGDEVERAVAGAMNQAPEMITFFKNTLEFKD
jgi:tripartite-type tricarboxylate transporter receptor subunit TctC